MKAFIRRAQQVAGTVRVPGDKSISHRAVLFAALAKGTTRVEGLAPGGDVLSSMACVYKLGVNFENTAPNAYTLDSPGRLKWTRRPNVLDAGNSGTTARLLMGMLAPVEGMLAQLEGDPSLSRRPMKRVAGPLAKMGADVRLTDKGTLPAEVHGKRLTGTRLVLDVASAQVKTAVLLAGLASEGETWVKEPEASRDHTELMLPVFGAKLLHGPDGVGVTAQELLAPTAPLVVPGDPSSAAFFAVAASIVSGARVRIEGVGLNPTRTGAVEILRRMGARITYTDQASAAEPYGTWVCEAGELTGTTIEGPIVPTLIDEIPILSVAAALAKGTTIIRNAQELRVKESDRLALMAKGLRSMGAQVEELPDGLVIEGGRPLKGAHIETDMDHRIAMSFAVAGLVADGETVVEGAEWAGISFPGFFGELARLTGGAVRTQ